MFNFKFVQSMQFSVFHFGLAHSGSRPFNCSTRRMCMYMYVHTGCSQLASKIKNLGEEGLGSRLHVVVYHRAV